MNVTRVIIQNKAACIDGGASEDNVTAVRRLLHFELGRKVHGLGDPLTVQGDSSELAKVKVVNITVRGSVTVKMIEFDVEGRAVVTGGLPHCP